MVSKEETPKSAVDIRELVKELLARKTASSPKLDKEHKEEASPVQSEISSPPNSKIVITIGSPTLSPKKSPKPSPSPKK